MLWCRSSRLKIRIPSSHPFRMSLDLNNMILEDLYANFLCFGGMRFEDHQVRRSNFLRSLKSAVALAGRTSETTQSRPGFLFIPYSVIFVIETIQTTRFTDEITSVCQRSH